MRRNQVSHGSVRESSLQQLFTDAVLRLSDAQARVQEGERSLAEVRATLAASSGHLQSDVDLLSAMLRTLEAAQAEHIEDCDRGRVEVGRLKNQLTQEKPSS